MTLGSLINRLLAPLGLRLHRRPSGLGRTGLSRQGEEAVIQDLIQGLEVEPYFVDVGAGDGAKDSNTARLALGGWRGVFFECDPPTLAVLAANFAGQEWVSVSGARVTPLNVAALLEGHGVPRDFGVLSLDIDSYDYHVLASLLERFRPTIVVAEINEKIPPPLAFSVGFHPEHRWDQSHFYGQSIVTLGELADRHGYSLVHLEYNNAFLVDADRTDVPGLTPGEAYETGYLNRPDRKKRFPWNSDVEEALTLPQKRRSTSFDACSSPTRAPTRSASPTTKVRVAARRDPRTSEEVWKRRYLCTLEHGPCTRVFLYDVHLLFAAKPSRVAETHSQPERSVGFERSDRSVT